MWYMCWCSISPGNIWTEMWTNALQLARDPDSMTQSGKNAQVGMKISLQILKGNRWLLLWFTFLEDFYNIKPWTHSTWHELCFGLLNFQAVPIDLRRCLSDWTVWWSSSGSTAEIDSSIVQNRVRWDGINVRWLYVKHV